MAAYIETPFLQRSKFSRSTGKNGRVPTLAQRLSSKIRLLWKRFFESYAEAFKAGKQKYGVRQAFL